MTEYPKLEQVTGLDKIQNNQARLFRNQDKIYNLLQEINNKLEKPITQKKNTGQNKYNYFTHDTFGCKYIYRFSKDSLNDYGCYFDDISKTWISGVAFYKSIGWNKITFKQAKSLFPDAF
jgi:hypothetical protein